MSSEGLVAIATDLVKRLRREGSIALNATDHYRAKEDASSAEKWDHHFCCVEMTREQVWRAILAYEESLALFKNCHASQALAAWKEVELDERYLRKLVNESVPKRPMPRPEGVSAA